LIDIYQNLRNQYQRNLISIELLFGRIKFFEFEIYSDYILVRSISLKYIFVFFDN